MSCRPKYFFPPCSLPSFFHSPFLLSFLLPYFTLPLFLLSLLLPSLLHCFSLLVPSCFLSVPWQGTLLLWLQPVFNVLQSIYKLSSNLQTPNLQLPVLLKSVQTRTSSRNSAPAALNLAESSTFRNGAVLLESAYCCRLKVRVAQQL